MPRNASDGAALSQCERDTAIFAAVARFPSTQPVTVISTALGTWKATTLQEQLIQEDRVVVVMCPQDFAKVIAAGGTLESASVALIDAGRLKKTFRK
jgi:hypothetical protein